MHYVKYLYACNVVFVANVTWKIAVEIAVQLFARSEWN